MLILISQAQTLDFESRVKFSESSAIIFKREAIELVQLLRKYKPEQLAALMGISPRLAMVNFERFRRWVPEPVEAQDRQAILAYRGDVYDGLQADQFSDADFHFAQEHIRILSGLYGLLKPLDRIQPYRLEMHTPLRTKAGKALYAYWTPKITEYLQKQLKTGHSEILLNLASLEYMKAVDPRKIKEQIITPVFRDYHNGKYKTISLYAKLARGAMSRFIIRNKITDVENICAFNTYGYIHQKQMSTKNHWVFTR
jgi:uncharacterized protein